MGWDFQYFNHLHESFGVHKSSSPIIRSNFVIDQYSIARIPVMNRSLPLRFQIALIVLLLIPISVFAEDTTRIQVARYSTVEAKPTIEQANILLSKVTVTFPSSVVNVSQAIDYLIQPYGYRISADASTDPRREILLSLSLPKIHRTLGPLTIRDALNTLAGPSWKLVEDPIRRLISFEICKTRR